MIEQKALGGILNLDDSNDEMPAMHHKNARNIRWRGNPGNMRPENIPGTTEIAFALPTADAVETIGAFYDPIKSRIFYFVYNSDAIHGIYILNVQAGTVATLIENGAGTDGDVLQFDLTRTIFNVNIIYGDTTQGDILYWLNCQKEPCKINIDRQLASGYGIVQRSFLDVIKAPFSIPPPATYEDDATITINNLRKKLFRFKIRPIYDDNDKGVWSAQSVMPIPVNSSDVTIDADPTKNARIAIVYQTGKPNVKKIEIAAAQSIGTVMGDFFSVAVLDKEELSLNDNDVAIFYFYNDKAYIDIDLKESVQLFDLVPLQANAQELLNGNTLDYGGILEGYDRLASMDNTAVSVSQINNFRTQPTDLLFAAQEGDTYGATTGTNIHIIVLGTINTGTVFNVYTTGFTITYTSIGGNDTADVIAGLSANAVSHGFTPSGADSYNLYILKTGQALLRFNMVAPAVVLSSTDATFTYDWSSRGAFALQYFDVNGITCGSQITDALSFQTNAYSESGGVSQIPKLTLSIYHQPPLEAHYFSIGRTKDLSKSKILQWISDRTFKDDIPTADGRSYAYVSIENLNYFISQNPSSSFLAYSFAAGDRIRFIKLYPPATIGNVIEANQDYEIQGQVINPIINGVQYQGQFIKIFLPTTSVNFDFGVQFHAPFLAAIDYSNYFIELYTPALSVAEGLDRYYEFGERYAIGNPETSTRFHQGMTQNQTTNYATPALFVFTKGDYYLRYRTINAGVEINYNVTKETTLNSIDLAGLDLASYITNPSYQVQSQPAVALSPFNYSNGNWIINVVDGLAHTFNITGQLVFKANNTGTSSTPPSLSRFNITVLNPASAQTGIALTSYKQLHADQTYTENINVSFTVPAGYEKIFIYFFATGTGANQQIEMISGNLKFIEQSRIISQIVIDPNFSDSFQSSVNSNGRAFINDINAKQVYYSTLIRWGLAYQVDTNINQVNRFYATNFDEVDKSKGDIQRFKSRDRIQRVFQKRGCGQLGVYAKFIQDSSGQNTLTTTDSIITSNNVQYYKGEHGVGDHPEGLVSSAYADYFIDPVTGDDMRLAENGLVSLNETFKGQYGLRDYLSQYTTQWNRIVGTFDYFENEVKRIFRGGTSNGEEINDLAYGFNEKRTAYNCFFDFHPDWILAAEDKVYSWFYGVLYIHNSTTYCNFYNTQFYPSITLVFNDKAGINKTFNALSYQSNKIWICEANGDVKTSVFNEQTALQQISQLKDVDFTQRGNYWDAAFLRDANSGTDAQLALVEGDYLEGNWAELKLTYKGVASSFLYIPYINWQLNNRNF